MATLPASAISLFHFDTNLNDTLGNATFFNNGAAHSTAQSKFGGKSLFFNGTPWSGNYTTVTLPSTDIRTVAMWIYVTALDTANWWPTAFSTEYNTDRGNYVHVFHPNRSYYPDCAVSNAAGGRISSTGNTIITKNTWHHLALTIDGITFKFYLDGIELASAVQDNPTSGNKIYLGGLRDSVYGISPTGYFKGFISELLVTLDVLWTVNFTPPTSAYETTPAFDPTVPAAKIKKWYFGGR